MEIDEDVIITANFKKQDGAIEIIYDIQMDRADAKYYATLTVAGKSVSGNSNRRVSE